MWVDTEIFENFPPRYHGANYVVVATCVALVVYLPVNGDADGPEVPVLAGRTFAAVLLKAAIGSGQVLVAAAPEVAVELSGSSVGFLVEFDSLCSHYTFG